MFRATHRFLLAGALALVLPACLLQNISATETLRDSIVGLNDELRWQRMDLAVSRVAPTFRAHFMESHQAWGRDIHVADTELMRVNLDEDGDRATSLVAVRWYSMRTMTLHQSMVEQSWQRAGRDFVLTDESVVSGATGILVERPSGDSDAAEGK